MKSFGFVSARPAAGTAGDVVPKPTPGTPVIVNQPDIFDRLLLSLNQAMLDDADWPAASALIDEACGTAGNELIVGWDVEGGVHISVAWFCHRDQRCQDHEREYFDVYHPLDERIPRLRRLPDSRLVRVADLYTDQELKTSPAYNEWLRHFGAQNGLNVRMDGQDGSRIVLATADPVKGSSWDATQIGTIERLLPHIRHFVQVRQAMAAADALGNSLGGMLDNDRLGVIHLDWRGRIANANDRALDILRLGDGLTAGSEGVLGTWLPADTTRFERLLARALPPTGRQGTGGSMTVRRLSGLPSLALHVTPVAGFQTTFRPRDVAALLLVVDPVSRLRVDPRLVANTLGLSAAESQVAISLAEGRGVRDTAVATGRTENAIRFHLKRIYRRLGISSQTDLVRLVLSLSDLPKPPS